MHLIAEGQVKSLLDGTTIYRYIVDVARVAGNLIIIEGPKVLRHDNNIIGFAIVAKSHISVHYNLAASELWFDVFSCEEFDAEAVLAFSRNALRITIRSYRLLNRGLETLTSP